MKLMKTFFIGVLAVMTMAVALFAGVSFKQTIDATSCRTRKRCPSAVNFDPRQDDGTYACFTGWRDPKNVDLVNAEADDDGTLSYVRTEKKHCYDYAFCEKNQTLVPGRVDYSTSPASCITTTFPNKGCATCSHGTVYTGNVDSDVTQPISEEE